MAVHSIGVARQRPNDDWLAHLAYWSWSFHHRGKNWRWPTVLFVVFVRSADPSRMASVCASVLRGYHYQWIHEWMERNSCARLSYSENVPTDRVPLCLCLSVCVFALSGDYQRWHSWWSSQQDITWRKNPQEGSCCYKIVSFIPLLTLRIAWQLPAAANLCHIWPLVSSPVHHQWILHPAKF